METGVNIQNNETQRRGNRRIWTMAEEKTLINILEDLVTCGYHCNNNTFKVGTTTTIEQKLCELFPNSGLKANPHIESKLKLWRKQYDIVYDMLQKSGFGWNDGDKCVEVDIDEVWQAYIQNAKTPINMAEQANQEEENLNDIGVEEGSYSPMSMNQTSNPMQSQPSYRKWVRPSDNIAVGLEKIAKSFDKMMEKSHEQMIEVVQCLKRNDENLQHQYVWEELSKLDISIPGRIKALRLFAKQPWNVNIMKTMDDALKLEFVMLLIGQCGQGGSSTQGDSSAQGGSSNI
ncbi:hypothetical protein UlMin_008094 [Ulmus minor]